MAEAKNTAKKEAPVEAAVVEVKKYIAKAVLIHKGETVHPEEEVELTAEQAARLLELGAIVEPEAE